MSKSQIKENEFSPAPGGTNGTVNYQTGYGTFASPDASQNPAHFDHSDKHIGNAGNTRKDNLKADANRQSDINAIYSKKDTPTPDDVVAGIKYELGRQNQKDKALAKQTVLDNLKKDPHFYNKLKMLDIDDESMTQNMNELKHPNDAAAKLKINTNIDATKEIFAEMAKGRDQKYVVNQGISDVMKTMWEQKNSRSKWKNAQ
jgi:hypothetical protein